MSFHVLITGANGSLGYATARYFLQHNPNSQLSLGVRASRSMAEKLCEEFPERTLMVDLDVTQAAAWATAVGEAEQRHGPITALINNAGYHDDALLANMRAEQWSGVLDTNLNAVFLGCQAVIPGMMRQRHGRIVTVASLSAILSPAGQTNYAAAKAGVLGLTQSLSKETARMGITVNAVCPGYIEGGLPTDWDDEHRKNLMRQIPMRRFAKPEEVASAIFFLASAEASYITGAHLKIDGGIL
jgi:3-oxoacyl-[acyl-carrier protein] reductase